MSRPRVLVESYVPYVPEELNRFFDISIVAPEDINAHSIKEFDAIIVRTRTRCDSSLLAGSKVKYVATATIGTDHIDIPWCRGAGIEVVSAPGCNAPAVAQYVFGSLLALPQFKITAENPNPLEGKTIAVVGVGNVGRIVVDWARKLGMNVRQCDPPRALAESAGNNVLSANGTNVKASSEVFLPLEDAVRGADIVTFHVPMTRSGDFPTYHLAGRSLFSSLKPGVVVVNAARGPVVDTAALIEAIDKGGLGATIIDTWEGEPAISAELLRKVTIGTPHIAGYSENGKIRAAAAVVNGLCHHFNVDYRFTPAIPAGAAKNVTAASIAASYSPLSDHQSLISAPASFEFLRNTYPLRPETPECIS